MRLHSIEIESIVDGPGIRAALFFQGCKHQCPECHNPETWSFKGGKQYTHREILDDLATNPLIKGITLTGGDPVYQWNECLDLLQEAKKKGYHLMLYTGFSMEELLGETGYENLGVHKLEIPRCQRIFRLYFLEMFDLIVTDPFLIEKRNIDIAFRGSTNQRIFEVTHPVPLPIAVVDGALIGPVDNERLVDIATGAIYTDVTASMDAKYVYKHP